MLSLFVYTLCASGTLLTLLGAYVFIKVFITPNKPPADKTNRINHLRLFFFGLQNTKDFEPVYKVTNKWQHFILMLIILIAPHLFVHIFPWLTRDEQENLK